MNSPEYIQTSLAAAMSLGFESGSFKDPVRLTGLNLLMTYDEGCLGKCAYCGIAGSRQDAENSRNAYGTTNNLNFQGTKNNQNLTPAVNNFNAQQALNNPDTRNAANYKYGEPEGKIIDTGLSSTDNLRISRKSSAKKTFIRVKWPVYRLDDVLNALKAHESSFERICLSMITHADAVRDTITISKKIKQFSNLPLSLLITPSLIKSPETLRQFKEAGAQMAGIAIDASTKDLFEKYRGAGVGGPHKWQKYWEVLKWAVDVFGRFKAGIHLIAGLGETEEEAVKIIYNAHLLGAKTHLFSFYPEPASILECLKRPELASYRKIQIARYLINEKGLDITKIRFNGNSCGNAKVNSFGKNIANNSANSISGSSKDNSLGSSKDNSFGISIHNGGANNINDSSSDKGSSGGGRIISFDYDLAEVLKEGHAFMTSGCPCSSDSRISACNRPFANERPSETFRNYPYLPNEEDKETIKSQISELLLTE